VRNKWEQYWFRPAPLFNLAVTRIIAVGYLIVWQIGTNFHANKLILSAYKPDFLYHPLPVVRLFLLGSAYRPSPAWLSLIWVISLVAGLLALIGFKTRFSLLLFAAANLFMTGFVYSFGEFHHTEALLLIALLALAFSPCGAVLSLDDWLERQRRSAERRQFEPLAITRETSAFARWPLLLVKWLFVLVYFSAMLSKVLSGGGLAAWTNGYTLQYYLMQDGLRWGSDLGVWLSHHTALVSLLSWMTLLFEGTFALAVLFPALAWIYIPFGAAFHTGIYLIQRAPFFSFIALYAVFVPWAALAERLGRRSKAGQPEIFYEGGCPLCLRSMTAISYFDWGNRLAYRALESGWGRLRAARPELTLEDCRREMHLLMPDNTVYKGYFAFRQIALQLPPFWPLAALMYLPFASTIGPRVYRWVALHRPRYDCDAETCLLPINPAK
jgi:predicted DCC family thiol-disulfide oxidoreductase YuxK/uncharacterized membrane protein YphA (DoxX/SURF4 family)